MNTNDLYIAVFLNVVDKVSPMRDELLRDGYGYKIGRHIMKIMSSYFYNSSGERARRRDHHMLERILTEYENRR